MTPRRKNIPWPQLSVFLAFATALLYIAAERGHAMPVLLVFAALMGFLAAQLSPRKKLLLGMVPAAGGLAVDLVIAHQQAAPDITGVLNLWVPLVLAALVGALVGARVRVFPGL